jgi:hypothetical protein
MLRSCAIVAPYNEVVTHLNQTLLSSVPGDRRRTYLLISALPTALPFILQSSYTRSTCQSCRRTSCA